MIVKVEGLFMNYKRALTPPDKKAITSITGKYTRGVIVYLLEDGVEFVEV